jgi:hypothetical protein
MNVGETLASAFHYARSKTSEINKQWTKISFSVGSRLPNSLLSASIQREGEVDVLIRCMEDESAERLAGNKDDSSFVLHYQNILSIYWIGGMYEIFRLLRERHLNDNDDAFQSILSDLESLRITLEKHEIAKDRKIESPLQMIKYPQKGDASDLYTYDPSDKTRAHIMRSGISQRGSIMWEVYDVKDQAERWIERRAISDQILRRWFCPDD